MLTEALHLSAEHGRVRLKLICLPMGRDLCVTLSGGDREHIGAIALGQADGTTESLLVPKHREEELARKLAGRLARHAQVTVSVACGIHLEKIQPSEIADVLALADQLTDDLIRWIS
jgi:hypothetical protein